MCEVIEKTREGKIVVRDVIVKNTSPEKYTRCFKTLTGDPKPSARLHRHRNGESTFPAVPLLPARWPVSFPPPNYSSIKACRAAALKCEQYQLLAGARLTPEFQQQMQNYLENIKVLEH
nr:uncharacterized protein LOC104086353 [Nicotiana tomentosiformis]